MGEGAERCLVRGKFERTGTQTHFVASDETGIVADQILAASDSEMKSAVEMLIQQLPGLGVGPISAIGHRIVQGGPHHTGPELVTPQLLEELRRLCPLDPPHLAAALEALTAARRWNPDIPQVACFDTSFHRTMPEVAQALPLPHELTKESGLLRYGFHGLSYEYIISELNRTVSPEIAQGKVIIAHLGNGASMAAVFQGKSVETTMGFTPASGLVMGSRSGDLDPGVIDFLLREGKISAKGLGNFIFQECGLKGVSALSSDLRELTAARQKNPLAQKAIDLFCYQARKSLGSLVAVLDGVETLIFTGGIGENASLPRAEICRGLHHLGLRLDAGANERHEPVISSPDSSLVVRVMKTNEELVIARHTASLVFSPQAPNSAKTQ
jgi:acetate kinase